MSAIEITSLARTAGIRLFKVARFGLPKELLKRVCRTLLLHRVLLTQRDVREHHGDFGLTSAAHLA